MSLFEELKRRNVFRVAAAYVVAAWLLLQVADIVLENIGTPDWVMQTLMLLLALGFPLAVILAWAFELTPEGVKREHEVDREQSITHKTGRKLNWIIGAMLALAIAYIAWDAAEDSAAPENVPNVAATEEESTTTEAVAQPTGAAPTDTSIAVLPFAHRSPDPNDQFFTDGIHDDLLTLLAKQDQFKVISRTSVMEYRDTTKNLRQIGDELGVRNIVEGGVQRAGNRVRLNIQLIDAQTDEHLWAETYDRELTTENLFDIQSEIAQAIAVAMHATLSDDSFNASEQPPTDNLRAYELYLRGKPVDLNASERQWRENIALLQEAVNLDPEFALAHLGLSTSYLTIYWTFGGDPMYRDMARAALDRALEIDPDLPEIQTSEGGHWYWGHLDYARAIDHLDRAIQLMPGNGQAYMWRGWALRRDGRLPEAIQSMEQSVALDPRSQFNWLELGQTYSYVHEYDKALELINRAKELNPADLWWRGYTTSIYLNLGDVDAALELAEETLRSTDANIRVTLWEPYLLSRDFDSALEFVRFWPEEFEVARNRFVPRELFEAEALTLAGRQDDAVAAANVAIERLTDPDGKFADDYRRYYALAEAYAAAGMADETLEAANKGAELSPADAIERFTDGYAMARSLARVGHKERALELLEPHFVGPGLVTVRYVELDPYWDGLRDDPDYIALLDKYRDR